MEYNRREIALFIILFLFVMFTFTYVFYVKDGYMYSGYTVFSDYAPHTAMMRSFSKGTNFPTQYPHFGGEDVKYHFMFQFLCGNLEYLGMRIDVAFNLMSAFGLTGFLVFLYFIAKRMTGKMITGVIAVLMFFFRSSFSFFFFVYEHVKTGDLLQAIKENTAFIGYTQNENWGLFNYNVYLNQRHLGFALLVCAFLVWYFYDYIEEKFDVKQLFFSKEGWIPLNVGKSVFLGFILGALGFWNGSAVIGTLLILCGFAFFSLHKLDYAIVAAITITMSELQAKFFIKDGGPSFQFMFGFIAQEKTIIGSMKYIIASTGILFVGVLVMLFFFKWKKKAMTISFILPLVFAFTISMTNDVTVNHKYVMLSMAFIGIMWAYVITKMLEKRILMKIAAFLMSVVLMITGIYDMVTIFRANGEGKSVIVDLNSNREKWVEENISTNDLVLSPEYSMCDVTLSGIMMYNGWPYYAWSAGYDTYARAENTKIIYSTYDKEQIKSIVKEEGIDFIIYENDMEYEGEQCHEETISEIYKKVYENEFSRIYKCS